MTKPSMPPAAGGGQRPSTPPKPENPAILHAHSELLTAARLLKQAAAELEGHAESVELADPQALRVAAIAINACAVRAVFSILSARGAGATLAMLSQGGAP
jgi:hypothetical protein